MTLFQLSYALLWILALVLVPVSLMLFFLFANFERGTAAAPSINFPTVIGTKMPRFVGTDLTTGVAVTSTEWRGLRHVLLVLSPDCSQCKTLLAALSSTSVLGGKALVVLCVASHPMCVDFAKALRSIPIVQLERKTWHLLGLAGVPAALMVGEDEVVLDVRYPTTIADIVDTLQKASPSRAPVALQTPGKIAGA